MEEEGYENLSIYRGGIGGYGMCGFRDSGLRIVCRGGLQELGWSTRRTCRYIRFPGEGLFLEQEGYVNLVGLQEGCADTQLVCMFSRCQGTFYEEALK